MPNTIEIQVLSSASRQQLIHLRDEIRLIEGFEGFELHIPATAPQPGAMGAEGDMAIAMAILEGVTHFAASEAFERLTKSLPPLLKKTFALIKSPFNSNMSMGSQKQEVVIANNNNGIRNSIYLDSEGKKEVYSNRQYSIDPDKTFALLVGTSLYDDSVSFTPISQVEKNLNDMYNVLNDKRLIGIPHDNIRKLHNASCYAIRQELNKLNKLEEIETLFFYYAGHGQNDGNNKLTLIAKDTRNDGEELCYDIPYSLIDQKMKSAKASQKIIIIDACNSGLATQSANNSVNFDDIYGSFILTSTSADEASYYKKGTNNTIFTRYLLEAFNGIKNTKQMLSLTDLYNYTKEKLKNDNLPVPHCKSQLENISPDKFFISSNPAFSLEAKLKEIDVLFRNGNYDEARKEYRLLKKSYPGHNKVAEASNSFDANVQYISLAKEGDELFSAKKYAAAKEKYEEASQEKYDPYLQDKILKCKQLQDSESDALVSPLPPISISTPFTDSDTLKKKKNPLIFWALMVVLALAYVLAKQISNHKPTENGEASPLQNSEKSVVEKTTSASASSTNKVASASKLTDEQAKNLVGRIPAKLNVSGGLPDSDPVTFDSLRWIIQSHPQYKSALIDAYETRAGNLKSLKEDAESEQYKRAADTLKNIASL